MKAERAERAALVAQPILEALSRERRHEMIDEAEALIKRHGVEGLISDVPVPTHLTRAQRRQVSRAAGWRGAKAKRHNLAKRLPKAATAVALDQSLIAARARMQMGPVERARLRLSERKTA